jgi:uncharacterized membrane protein YgcG
VRRTSTALSFETCRPRQAKRAHLFPLGLRRPGTALRSLLCLIALLAFLSWPLLAKELRIESFRAQIDVLPDSTVSVTESITAHFLGGPWHGLYREIPVEYYTPQGMNYSLFLEVKDITDGSGRPLRFESSRERHYRKLKIFIDNADDSVQTINIEYTVANALKFHEDFDEFYWNVTGDEWDVPISSASASITLPAAAKHIRANFATGAYGSRGQDAQISIADNGVEVHTTSPLPYHHGLTVAVAFDKGVLREPTTLDQVVLFFRSNWPLVFPCLVALIMYWIWYKNGRDPRLRPVAAQYEPPDKLTPSEVGTLIDNSADMRDITAAIVDLAVRGYLVIRDRSDSHMMGLYKTQSYSFILKKGRAEWSSLKPHEQSLLDGIFTVGQPEEVVDMEDLHNVFYKNIPIIKNQIFAQLLGHGYYLHRPDTVRATYIGAGLLIGFLAIWGGAAMGRSLGMAGAPFVIAGIASAAIVCGFGWFMPARTPTGTRALEGVLGFEDFLAHVEADRFNRMIKTPAMFEKFLPFAMALGVEKNWSKAFANIYTEPPQWYQGGNFSSGFYPYLFVNNLNALSSQAATTFVSAPRSSGGSGFGGGGGSSSGGGFGGGGGGGF